VDYVIKCSKLIMEWHINKSISWHAIMAKECSANFPVAGLMIKIAGIDWLQGFKKRHKNLTPRKPENTSLFRATAFSKTNVMEFFDNYERALKFWKFTADRMYNIEETGVSTVLQPFNIVAQTETKQVGQAVSGEWATMITACMIINSVGNTVPPVFISLRARLNDSLMFHAPPGSLGLVSSPQSTWITGPVFLKVLEYVKKRTRSSKEDCIILLMENHESHCTLYSILYARENGYHISNFSSPLLSSITATGCRSDGTI